MSYLFAISLCLSLLISSLLFFTKEKTSANYTLLVFFLLASFNIAYIFSKYLLGPSLYIPIISELNATFPIVYALLLYVYAKEIILPEFSIAKLLPKLLVGFFAYLFIYCCVRHLIDDPTKILASLIYLLKPIINIIVIAKLWLFISTLSKTGFWNEKNKHFKLWLQWLAIGGLFICCLSMVGYVLQAYYPDMRISYGDFWICAFLSIYFFSLSIIAFSNSTVFQRHWIPKPLKSLLVDHQTGEIQLFEELKSYVELKKPYLDPDLSIAKLAEQVDLPTSKLSRLINQYGNATFFEFINSYRVEEVKSMIHDQQNAHLSLLGIALDSGFNNKASFNRTFKKYTGMTPSQFQKQNIS